MKRNHARFLSLFLVLFLMGLFYPPVLRAQNGSLKTPDPLQVKTLAPNINPSLCEGTDPDAGKSSLTLALPKLGNPENLSTLEAQKVLNAAIASLSIYGGAKYPWPATWTRISEVRVDPDQIENRLQSMGMSAASGSWAVLRGVGFHAAAYRTAPNEILIAYEGTDLSQREDIAADLAQVALVPGQYLLGELFAQKVQKENPNSHLVLTGHSLGGGIAQFVAAKLGLSAVTFNPAGLFLPALVSIKFNGHPEKSHIVHVVTSAYRFQEGADPVSCRRDVQVSRQKDVVSSLGVQLGKVYYVPIATDASVKGIHSMARLETAIAAIAQAGHDASEHKKVIAIVDSSGSMSQSDSKNLRLAAIRMMIDTLGDNTSLGLVDFDSEARTVFDLQPLGPFGGSTRKELEAKLSSIDANGGTNIRAGLSLAASLAGKSTKNLTFVLLTDGQDGNWHGEDTMLPPGVPVDTIALSDHADRAGLSKLSGATGGIHEIARSGYDLPRIMGEIFAQAGDQQVLLAEEGTIQQGQRVNYTVVLPSYQNGHVDIQVSWPGSDIGLELVDPKGHRYPLSQAVQERRGVKGSTYDILRLNNPMAGTWRIELRGIAIAPGGEPYTMRVTSQGGPVRAHWKTNVVSPEVGQQMTCDLDTEGNNVRWQRADVQVWNPDGSREKKQIRLNGLSAALGGRSGQTVMTIRPGRQGVYRVKIVAHGLTTKGEKVVRTFDRTYQVMAPGHGVRYRHQIDPFIRRVPGMLK